MNSLVDSVRRAWISGPKSELVAEGKTKKRRCPLESRMNLQSLGRWVPAPSLMIMIVVVVVVGKMLKC